MITFSYIDVECRQYDKLLIYNEDRTNVMFDYCYNQQTGNNRNFIMAKAKYLIIRMETSSTRLLTAVFDLVLVDAYSASLIQPAPPAQLLSNTTTQVPFSSTTTTPVRETTSDVKFFREGFFFFFSYIKFRIVKKFDEFNRNMSSCTKRIKRGARYYNITKYAYFA